MWPNTHSMYDIYYITFIVYTYHICNTRHLTDMSAGCRCSVLHHQYRCSVLHHQYRCSVLHHQYRCSVLHHQYRRDMLITSGTGCRRPIGRLISCITFRKLATNCRALLPKITYKDKTSSSLFVHCLFYFYVESDGE